MPPRERRLDILRIDVGDELNYATYMLREMCTRGEMLQKEFMDEFHRVGAQAQAFKDSFGKFTHSWDKDEFHCINVVPVPPALDKDGNPRTKRVENYEFTVPTADEYQAIRSRELEFAQRYAGNGEAVADRMARWDVLNPPTVSQTVLRGYRREPIGSSRNSLVWIGPTADAVAAALDDRKLDRSFEALERRMLDERDDTTAKH